MLSGRLLVGMYLGAIVAANTLVARFGVAALPITAFFMIGLDLSSRDGLHELWRSNRLWPRMAALVGSGAVLSWLLNMDHPRVAIASTIAFASAGLTDTIVYQVFGTKLPRILRVNGSNVGSGMVDSWVFPLVAFGIVNPLLGLSQFALKVAGGFMWSLVLRATLWKRTAAPAAAATGTSR